MLLTPTQEKGEEGKAIFNERLRRFLKGEWRSLLDEAAASWHPAGQAELDEETAIARRREEAEAKIRLREVSRARTVLTSSGLAPGTKDTLNKLRSQRPAEPKPLPAEATGYRPPPSSRLKVDRKMLIAALRGAGRGSAQDLAGMRYAHL